MLFICIVLIFPRKEKTPNLYNKPTHTAIHWGIVTSQINRMMEKIPDWEKYLPINQLTTEPVMNKQPQKSKVNWNFLIDCKTNFYGEFTMGVL